MGGGIYAQTDKSGAVSLGAPSDLGYASLKSGGLEASNVNITDELTAMIKAQQQFNGSARLMQTNSEMVEKLTRRNINLSKEELRLNILTVMQMLRHILKVRTITNLQFKIQSH